MTQLILSKIAGSERRHRPGYLFLELIVALSLFVVFSLSAARVIRLMLEAPRKAREAQTVSQQLDAAVEQLRRDVWSGSVLRIMDNQTLEITGAPEIIWHMGDDGTLTRIIGLDPFRTREWLLGGRATVSANGPTAIFMFVDSAGRSTRLELVSQKILAGKSHS